MIVCADDYGLRADVDQAILALAGSRRLTAVSCMAALERCDGDLLARLRAHEANVDIGLHLCFTHEPLALEGRLKAAAGSRRLPTCGQLVRQSFMGGLAPKAVAWQIAVQYDLFVAKCGRKPDFLDGHLHVHQLPGIRAGLIEFLAELPVAVRPYVRNTGMPLRRLWAHRLPWAKAAFICPFGRRLARELKAASLVTNEGFAGIYDFRRWPRYPEYLPRFAACLTTPNGILVTHPGQEEDWRRQEFEALRGHGLAAARLNRFLL